MYTTRTDDQLHSTARKIISALIARIHTVEWTTAIVQHPAGRAAQVWVGRCGVKNSTSAHVVSPLLWGVEAHGCLALGAPWPCQCIRGVNASSDATPHHIILSPPVLPLFLPTIPAPHALTQINKHTFTHHPTFTTVLPVVRHHWDPPGPQAAAPHKDVQVTGGDWCPAVWAVWRAHCAGQRTALLTLGGVHHGVCVVCVSACVLEWQEKAAGIFRFACLLQS